MPSAKTLVDTKIAGKKVVVFSKTTCGFCMTTKSLLKQYKLSADELEIIEINEAPYNANMNAIQDYLRSLTGARTVSAQHIS